MTAALKLSPGRGRGRAPRAPRRVVAQPPEGAFAAVAWAHLTPRQSEVFALPRDLVTLRRLILERPRGACVVCWRDLSHVLAGADELACTRDDNPESTTAYCNGFVYACRAHGARQCESAKASLIAELEAGHV